MYNMECTYSSKDMPKENFCTLTEVDNPCTQALIRLNIEECLWKCTFTADKEQIHSMRVQDDGVYIGDTKFAISEGNKVIYSVPPLIVYSNSLITLTDPKGEEVKYPALIPFTEQKIVQSMLTSVQQTLVQTRGLINDFWSNIDYTEYINYFSWGLQILIMPLTFLGLILTCRHKKLITKAVKRVSEKKVRRGRAAENDVLLRRLDM